MAFNYLAFSLLCVMKCCMAPKKDSNFVSSLGASTEISVYRDLGTQIDTLGKGSQKKGGEMRKKLVSGR